MNKNIIGRLIVLVRRKSPASKAFGEIYSHISRNGWRLNMALGQDMRRGCRISWLLDVYAGEHGALKASCYMDLDEIPHL